MLHRLNLVIPFLLIAALAFGYRAAIMADRAAAPNEVSGWDPLPEGSDQRTYIHLLHKLQSGEYPPERFFYQPGIVYMLGAAAALLQTNDLQALRLFFAALSALNCGFLAYLTGRMTGRRHAGYAAGLLLALYPVSACYDTDFVITSQALILATLMFGCAWAAFRHPRNLLAPLLLGLLAGAGTITRFEMVAPGFICVLWLIYQRRDALALRQFSLVIIGALFVLAPIALHNRAGGANFLFTPVGPHLLYFGNNRDAAGISEPSNAEASTRLDYFHYLQHDIGLEPGRFIQLSLHKAALFLSSIEPGQNLDFRKSCHDLLGLLAHNPLNFSILLFLTTAGWLALWRDGHRSFLWLSLLGGGAHMSLVLLIIVESRLKTPVVAWMIPAAGYAIYCGIRALRSDALPVLLRRQSHLLAAIAILLLLIQAGATQLPRDITVTNLPPDATAVGLIYDDALELVGWKVREQYSPNHTIEPFHPWVVSLYWRLLHPTEIDYSFSLKYYIGDEALLEYDRPLGYTVYPRDYTSDWQVGAIYVEHIGLTWRGYTGPFEQTGRVMLDVYPERELHQRFRPQNAHGGQASHPVLAQPTILLAPGRNNVPTNDEVSFGGELLLLGHELQTTGAEGGASRKNRMAYRLSANRGIVHHRRLFVSPRRIHRQS